MATASEWATRVTEIETAIHDLATGARVVRISSPDGTLVEYQPGDMSKLLEYLDFAKQQQASTGGSQKPGPINFIPL